MQERCSCVENLVKDRPEGVAEAGKGDEAGVGQQPNVPWLTYQDAKGRVVYGGRPMPKAPRSVSLRG